MRQIDSMPLDSARLVNEYEVHWAHDETVLNLRGLRYASVDGDIYKPQPAFVLDTIGDSSDERCSVRYSALHLPRSRVRTDIAVVFAFNGESRFSVESTEAMSAEDDAMRTLVSSRNVSTPASDRDALSVPVIGGIAAASVCAYALLVLAIVVFVLRHRRRDGAQAEIVASTDNVQTSCRSSELAPMHSARESCGMAPPEASICSAIGAGFPSDDELRKRGYSAVSAVQRKQYGQRPIGKNDDHYVVVAEL